MDWSKGFSSVYYAVRVDPATWRDLERIELTGGAIKREPTGLRESADIDCVDYPIDIEQWIRVYLDVRQGGDSEHVALFTGLATSPKADINGRMRSDTLACYSVLKPADDIPLLRGWYAPAGARGGDVIRQLLSATPAPIDVAEDSPKLTASIVAEDNESRLTMAEKVLAAIDWRMKINGNGSVRIEPKPTEATVTFDPVENDVIETQISVEADWYSCPNVYMAISDDMTGIARDDDPKSPLSTVSRGREVWLIEDSADLADNTSIAKYAKRQLEAAQKVQKTADYDRRFFPALSPGDLVRLHYPEQGLDGYFTIESQSIELTHGARTSEQISTYLTADQLRPKEKAVLFVNIIDHTGSTMVTDDNEATTALTEMEI